MDQLRELGRLAFPGVCVCARVAIEVPLPLPSMICRMC
jgi:hypothetical protein